jgi:hypothetical protein
MNTETSQLECCRNIIFSLYSLHCRGYRDLRICSFWIRGKWNAVLYKESQAPDFSDVLRLSVNRSAISLFIDPRDCKWKNSQGLSTPKHIEEIYINELRYIENIKKCTATLYSEWLEKLILFMISDFECIPIISPGPAVYIHFKTNDMKEATRTMKLYDLLQPDLPAQVPNLGAQKYIGPLDLTSDNGWHLDPYRFFNRPTESGRNIYTRELDGYFD